MGKPNHLAAETSPYLLQHVNNPVDWYPWNEETLATARDANKPVLLSIGYTACHWCHVMAHESFEDQETAQLMNELFINIKVDREERPDLDKIYQNTHYLLTQRSGGWPLTVFLTPDDLTPFFSGTYFPLKSRYNLPAFKEVLQSVANLYHNQRSDITQQNHELLKALNHENLSDSTNIQLNNQPLKLAIKALQQNYDATHGGFGSSPKFPHPLMLEFLLKEKSELVFNTLQQMAQGGIYDQLAGGFFRYTVDAAWRIPHFEKMLYDNAALLFLYALAAREYRETFFSQVARETAEWVLTKMQSPEGGFYSSLNADSEGHEGKFYIWNKFEINSLLNPAEYNLATLFFALNKEPNFEKHWHLYIAEPLESIALRLNLSLAETNQLLLSTKQKLLQTREQRIAPECDTKILTAWNALMIKALFITGEILKEPRFTQAALKSLTFIQQKLWINKRLYATYHNQKPRFAGYLDDYAFLLDTLINKLQITWDTEQLRFVIELADSLLQHFTDDKAGGFYFTANDHEKLMHRPKSFADEAIPSGNGIAARALIILGHLLGEPRYLEAAYKTLSAAWNLLLHIPAEHCSLLLALNDYLESPYTIVIRGNKIDCKIWQTYCQQQSNSYIFAIPNEEQNLPGLLATHPSKNTTCAYVCKGTQCLAVIEDFEKLKKTL